MPVSELKSLCFKILWITVSNVGIWLDTWDLMPRNFAFWWAALQHLKPRQLIPHEFRREHLIPHLVEMQCMGGMLSIEHKEVNLGTGLKFSFKSSSVQSYARPLWWSGICSQTLFLCIGIQIMCLWRGMNRQWSRGWSAHAHGRWCGFNVWGSAPCTTWAVLQPSGQVMEGESEHARKRTSL